MTDHQPQSWEFNNSEGYKQKENQNKQHWMNTGEGDSQIREKKCSIPILQDAYSSPVCYAGKKEEMRADFWDT